MSSDRRDRYWWTSFWSSFGTDGNLFISWNERHSKSILKVALKLKQVDFKMALTQLKAGNAYTWWHNKDNIQSFGINTFNTDLIESIMLDVSLVRDKIKEKVVLIEIEEVQSR